MSTAPFCFRTDARGLIGPRGPLGPAFSDDLLRSLIATLYHDDVEHPSDQDVERWQAALTAVEAFQPRDAVEAMLAAEVVGIHHGVMECLHRAMQQDLSEEAASRVRTTAATLVRALVTLLQALERRQAKPLPDLLPAAERVDAVAEEDMPPKIVIPEIQPVAPRDATLPPQLLAMVHAALNEQLDRDVVGSPAEWYAREREALRQQREASAAQAAASDDAGDEDIEDEADP